MPPVTQSVIQSQYFDTTFDTYFQQHLQTLSPSSSNGQQNAQLYKIADIDTKITLLFSHHVGRSTIATKLRDNLLQFLLQLKQKQTNELDVEELKRYVFIQLYVWKLELELQPSQNDKQVSFDYRLHSPFYNAVWNLRLQLQFVADENFDDYFVRLVSKLTEGGNMTVQFVNLLRDIIVVHEIDSEENLTMLSKKQQQITMNAKPIENTQPNNQTTISQYLNSNQRHRSRKSRTRQFLSKQSPSGQKPVQQPPTVVQSTPESTRPLPQPSEPPKKPPPFRFQRKITKQVHTRTLYMSHPIRFKTKGPPRQIVYYVNPNLYDESDNNNEQ